RALLERTWAPRLCPVHPDRADLTARPVCCQPTPGLAAARVERAPPTPWQTDTSLWWWPTGTILTYRSEPARVGDRQNHGWPGARGGVPGYYALSAGARDTADIPPSRRESPPGSVPPGRNRAYCTRAGRDPGRCWEREKDAPCCP